ncbi:MAG: hypothetical protein LBH24_03710 [Clostridiales bacterium]|jgi:hypothetical protein|nr:hypothetical protein [Clostridiales bacterium]
MIHIIYGNKGSGKTKRVIEAANKRAGKSQGVVVYLTDRPEHSADVDSRARFINIDKYGVGTPEGLYGFLQGMVAGNYDITDLFIDGLSRFIGRAPEDTEAVFEELSMISAELKVDMTFTLSVAELPQSLLKYS